jgi:hypothetical protein
LFKRQQIGRFYFTIEGTKYEIDVGHNDATAKQKIDFFESYFSIIEKNLLHKNNRKIFEGILISTENQILTLKKITKS